MGIVVWKSVIKHACAPHAHICAHLSQRQSHSYLLQPNHLTEVFVATKQLGIFFCLQLPSIQWIWWNAGILLSLVTKYGNAWKQCNWLLREHPLPCMYMGVSCIYSWLVGKVNSPGLTVFPQWPTQLPPVLLRYICIWRGDQILLCVAWEWINILQALWISIMQVFVFIWKNCSS